MVVRDGRRADVVVVMMKDDGGLGAVKSCGHRWRGLVQVAVHVGVVSRLRRGSRKTDAVGMPAARSRRRCCRGAAEVAGGRARSASPWVGAPARQGWAPAGGLVATWSREAALPWCTSNMARLGARPWWCSEGGGGWEELQSEAALGVFIAR